MHIQSTKIQYFATVWLGMTVLCGIFALFFWGGLPSQATNNQYSVDDNLIITNDQYCEDTERPIDLPIIDDTPIDAINPRQQVLLDTWPSVFNWLAPELYQAPTCYTLDETQIEIYMYHYVRPTRWDAEWSVVWNNSITPETARDHYEHLAKLKSEQKIHIAWMSEIQQYQATNCFPHPRIVVLTFDDWRWDNFNYLLPLAKEFDIKANLWIIANRISRDFDDRIDSFMTYDEIRWMIESGYFEIQGHSKTHTDLTAKWADAQRDEICTSSKSLEDIFWVSINTFIYPMWLYNNLSIDTARNCGLPYALTTREWTNTADDILYDRYQLYRKRVGKWMTGAELYGE